MNFTAAQIREDMALCHGRLEEKFLKTDDPTMVIGKFLEDAGRCMSSIQKGFNEKAKSRNEIIAPTIKELDKLSGLIGIAKAGLQKHIDGEASPEDDNTSINSETNSVDHGWEVVEADSLGEFLDDFASDVLKKSFSGFLNTLTVKKRGGGFDVSGYTRSDLRAAGHFMFRVGGMKPLEVTGMLSIPDRDDHKVSFEFNHQKFTKNDVVKEFKREFDLR